MIIISDTSPITNLVKIGQLELLHDLFGDVVIPPQVHSEILALNSLGVDISSYLNASWKRIESPSNKNEVISLKLQLDPGESEAIALAMEFEDVLLLIDERRGRKIAESKGIETIGILGCLIQAKSIGAVKNIKPIIDALINNAGFWLSEQLVKAVLEEVGE